MRTKKLKNNFYEIYGKETFKFIHGYPSKLRKLNRLYNAHLRYYKNKLKYGKSAPNPFKTIYIDPDKINEKTTFEQKFVEKEFEIPTKKSIGTVKGGNWDKNTSKIENWIKFKGLKQRFDEEQSWEDTEIFKQFKKVVEVKGEWSGCKNKEELLTYYKNVDRLYNEIKKNGYKTQKELRDKKSLFNLFNEVGVNIGRNGRIIHHGEGGHRLSIAKILDLDSIPVTVVIRHEKWQEKRNKAVESSERLSREGRSHPDIKILL